MIQIEEIAKAALAGNSLETRSLAQDFYLEHETLATLPRPETTDARVLALSAGLAELFAERLHETAPAWTKSIGAVDEPIFLVKSALSMKHLRELCEQESPLPLRARRFYVPPNYLEFA